MTSDERPGPDEIVEMYWPYDGPRDPELTASAAVAIERLTRYLNNTTQYDSGVPYAATVGAIMTAQRAAVQLQDQLLDQCQRRLIAVADDPNLYDWTSSDTSPRQIALDGATKIQAAQEARARYAAALAEATKETGRLSGGTDI